MRTIKFRGKRIDNQEWVFGSLDLTANQASILWDRIDNDGDAVPWWADVQPDTVGQFTGFSDKTGKEIYESDILKMSIHDRTETCAVGWNDKIGAWCIAIVGNYYSLGSYPLGQWVEEAKFEIIGNMYENRELLSANNQSD